MKKAITLSALAAIALTSEMGDEFVGFDDNELFNIKEVQGKQAPVKIYRDLGFEDQTDNHLFHYTKVNPKLPIQETLKVPVQLDDDEFFVDFDDEELFNIKELPGKQAPIKIYRDLGFEDQTDHNLAHFGDAIGEVAPPKKPHNKNKIHGFLKDHVKAPQDVKLDDDEYFVDFDDEELFNVKEITGKPAPVKVYRDLGFEDQTDHHFAHFREGFVMPKKGKELKEAVHQAVFGYDDDELFLDEEADNNLAQLGSILKEGKEVKKNLKGLKETLKVPVDVKLDDDEFFPFEEIKKNMKPLTPEQKNEIREKYRRLLGFYDDELFVDFDENELFVDFDDNELLTIKPEPVKIHRDLGFEDQTDNQLFRAVLLP